MKSQNVFNQIDNISSFSELSKWVNAINQENEKQQMLTHLKSSLQSFLEESQNDTIRKHLSMLHDPITSVLPLDLLAYTMTYSNDCDKIRHLLVSKSFYDIVNNSFQQRSGSYIMIYNKKRTKHSNHYMLIETKDFRTGLKIPMNSLTFIQWVKRCKQIQLYVVDIDMLVQPFYFDSNIGVSVLQYVRNIEFVLPCKPIVFIHFLEYLSENKNFKVTKQI